MQVVMWHFKLNGHIERHGAACTCTELRDEQKQLKGNKASILYCSYLSGKGTLVLRILSSVISDKPSTISLIVGSLDAVYKCVLNKKVLKWTVVSNYIAYFTNKIHLGDSQPNWICFVRFNLFSFFHG